MKRRIWNLLLVVFFMTMLAGCGQKIAENISSPEKKESKNDTIVSHSPYQSHGIVINFNDERKEEYKKDWNRTYDQGKLLIVETFFKLNAFSFSQQELIAKIDSYYKKRKNANKSVRSAMVESAYQLNLQQLGREKIVINELQPFLGNDSFTNFDLDSQDGFEVEEKGNSIIVSYQYEHKIYHSIYKGGKWIEKDKELKLTGIPSDSCERGSFIKGIVFSKCGDTLYYSDGEGKANEIVTAKTIWDKRLLNDYNHVLLKKGKVGVIAKNEEGFTIYFLDDQKPISFTPNFNADLTNTKAPVYYDDDNGDIYFLKKNLQSYTDQIVRMNIKTGILSDDEEGTLYPDMPANLVPEIFSVTDPSTVFITTVDENEYVDDPSTLFIYDKDFNRKAMITLPIKMDNNEVVQTASDDTTKYWMLERKDGKYGLTYLSIKYKK